MTRYELATLSVALGSTNKVAEAVAAWSGSGEGTLLGCWAADIGALNEVVVLRGFADDAALARERLRALHAASPFGCAEWLRALSMDSYAPFPDRPPVPSGALGPTYEIRSYVLKTGGLAPTLAGWAEKLPGRVALSPLAVVMYALDGAPRFTHVWPYAGTNERARIRAEAVAQGLWPPGSAPWLETMRSGIYLPTAVSPLR